MFLIDRVPGRDTPVHARRRRCAVGDVVRAGRERGCGVGVLCSDRDIRGHCVSFVGFEFQIGGGDRGALRDIEILEPQADRLVFVEARVVAQLDVGTVQISDAITGTLFGVVR